MENEKWGLDHDTFAIPIILPASTFCTLIPTPLIHAIFIHILTLSQGLMLTAFPVTMLVGQVHLEVFSGGPVTLIALEKAVFVPCLKNKSV